MLDRDGYLMSLRYTSYSKALQKVRFLISHKSKISDMPNYYYL